VLLVFLLLFQPQLVDSHYAWEDYSYYEILGLEDSNVKPFEIKKAYRKQARMYHPDKQSEGEKLTSEEATARFSLIAEAYEVLSDDKGKSQYDVELAEKKIQGVEKDRWRRQHEEYEEWQQKQEQQAKAYTKREQPGRFSFRDPLEMFENFFAGGK